jgi:hypothetical protein
MLKLYLTEISCAFIFRGNDIKKTNILKNTMYCVCLCLYEYYKSISFHEQRVGKVIWNVADCIRPIRLRYIEGCLAGKSVTAMGWGRTSDS